MVTLIWEGYFEKNILPLLKTSPGEASPKLIYYLSFLTANNSAMLVSRYFEADIKLTWFLGAICIGFLIVKDPNTLL